MAMAVPVLTDQGSTRRSLTIFPGCTATWPVQSITKRQGMTRMRQGNICVMGIDVHWASACLKQGCVMVIWSVVMEVMSWAVGEEYRMLWLPYYLMNLCLAPASNRKPVFYRL